MATDAQTRQKRRAEEAKRARREAARKARQRKILVVVAVLAVLALIAGIAIGALSGSTSSSSKNNAAAPPALPAAPATAPPVTNGDTISGKTPCPAADGSSKRAAKFAQAPPMCIDPAKNYTATFDTTEGKIVVPLDTKKTPNTTNNFVVLSRYHYYDGSAIFRSDPTIDIIQGGGPATQNNTDPGPGYTIKDEGVPFTYKDGDLIMANTGSPDSSGAQYFFGTGPNVAQLNQQGSYLNFGHTTEGLDVLHKIIKLNKGSGRLGGAPSRPVTLNKITITES